MPNRYRLFFGYPLQMKTHNEFFIPSFNTYCYEKRMLLSSYRPIIYG